MITKPILETNVDEEGSVTGSWAPTLILFLILFIRWIAFGQDNLAVRLRRFCNIQRVRLKKRFGYRDDSKYDMSVGDGSNQKNKRQG